MQNSNDFKRFILDSFQSVTTRQITIDYLKSRFRYYEGIAGCLCELENKRELTQAEKVRQRYYNEPETTNQ